MGFSQAKGFWEEHVRGPSTRFLKAEALFPDRKGALCKLEELVFVEEEIIRILGEELLERALGCRKAAHLELRKLRSVHWLSLDEVLKNEDLLTSLRKEPRKLAELYRECCSLR